ncbi:MAG: ABC transporter permease [Ilumatobacteraceae bacterium]
MERDPRARDRWDRRADDDAVPRGGRSARRSRRHRRPWADDRHRHAGLAQARGGPRHDRGASPRRRRPGRSLRHPGATRRRDATSRRPDTASACRSPTAPRSSPRPVGRSPTAASGSTTSDSGDRRSTRCSSRSPATPPTNPPTTTSPTTQPEGADDDHHPQSPCHDRRRGVHQPGVSAHAPGTTPERGRHCCHVRRSHAQAVLADAGPHRRRRSDVGDVPAHLPLRVRRRDRHRRRQLRRLPDPGLAAAGALFWGAGGAVGVATDNAAGLLDRMRSLPVPRAAILFGRSLADTVLVAWGLLITVALGFATGFRLHGSMLDTVAGVALCLLYGAAFTWPFIYMGLVASSAQAAQGLSFLIFPFVFVSSAYVPVESMPGWMQPIAEHQPITPMVGSVRALAFGDQAEATLGHSAAWFAVRGIAWSLLLMAVFVPLATHRFARS